MGNCHSITRRREPSPCPLKDTSHEKETAATEARRKPSSYWDTDEGMKYAKSSISKDSIHGVSPTPQL